MGRLEFFTKPQISFCRIKYCYGDCYAVVWAESTDMVKIFRILISHEQLDGIYLEAFDQALATGNKNDLIVDNSKQYMV